MNSLRERTRSPKLFLARALTELLSPVILVVGLLLIVGAASGGPSVRSGLAWGLLAALFVGVVPYAFLVLGVRRGRWTDRHVGVREQRIVPLVFAATSSLVGLALIAALGAPRQLVALVVAGLIGLGVSLAITRAWKISIHTAVAAGTATVLTLVFGAWLMLGWPLVAALGWSRWELRDHTLAQVLVGAVIGSLVAGVVFAALR